MTVENTLDHGLKTSVLDSANKVEQDQNWAALDPNRISSGTFANRPAAGTANRFYYANDTQVLYWDDGTTWDTVSDGVVQRVNTQTGAVATGTTTLPFDDTIPQNTEGDEYMTLAITPTDATNILTIDVVWIGSNTTTSTLAVALFQDSVASTLAVDSITVPSATGMFSKSFSHMMVAGTVSATTFKVRAGASAAGTTTFNGSSGGRKYGGLLASSITITETKV